MDEFPPELTQDAAPLVALVSDVPYLEMLATQLAQAPAAAAAVRASAGTAARAADAVLAARYVVRPLSHTFVTKRQSGGVGRAHTSTGMEGGVAQSIFKANWLSKHHNDVPSVVVPVVDVDSALTTIQWADVEAHVNDVVVRLRPSMLGRSNDLHLLLVQQRDYTRAKEDRDTLELMDARIQSLRRRVGLDSRQVTVINTADITSVSPALVRLDAFIRDRASQYYRFHARRVKKAAKQVYHRNRSLHVRLCFKVAHFYEFCGLADKSIAQLNTAYKGLCGLNMDISNYPEVKAVAEMISFKIVQHHIRAGAARLAVGQFKTHMRWFRHSVGSDAVAYRHWSWVRRQYVVMAQLFNRYLPRVTRATDPYQTAAYYYHAAAMAAIKRQDAAAASGCYPGGPALARPEVEHAVQPSIFVGGTPRVVMLGTVPPTDLAALKWNCLVAHYAAQESRVDHCAQVMELLELTQQLDVRDGRCGGGNQPLCKGSSFTFDLIPAASRARLWRQTMMATQLLKQGKHDLVKRLLEPVALRYRQEGWWWPLQGVLHMLLDCALALGDVDSFLATSLQLMSRNIQGGGGVKSAVQRKFLLALTAPHTMGAGFKDAADGDDATPAAAAGAGAGTGAPGAGAGAGADPTPEAADSTAADGGGAGEATPPVSAPRLRQRMRLELPLDATKPLLTAHVGFVARTARYGAHVEVTASLTSHFPLPIHFSRLTVEFSDGRYNRAFRDPTPLQTRRRASLMAASAGALAAIASAAHDLPQDIDSDDEEPAEGGGSGSGAKPRGSTIGDASPPANVDLSLLPGCANDFSFTVPLVAPPAATLPDGTPDPRDAGSPEALVSASRVVLELDLGSAVSGSGYARRVVVFNLTPEAAPAGIGRLDPSAPSASFIRRLSMVPLHSKAADAATQGGSGTAALQKAGAGGPKKLGPSPLGKGKGALARQLSSLDSREDEGPHKDLLVLHPDTHMQVSMKLEPRLASVTAAAAAAAAASGAGGGAGAGGARTAATGDGATAADSTGDAGPLLIGALHAVTVTVAANKEACVGGVAFFDWGFGDPILFAIASDTAAANLSFDVDLPAPDGGAPSRVRFVGVDPRVGVPLGYIPARGTRKITLFLRLPRAATGELQCRVVFATGGDRERAGADGSGWMGLVRTQPHMCRRTSATLPFTSVTPLQASYELVLHGLLLDCDGMPGTDNGRATDLVTPQDPLSMGRVSVNQPFLVYCRVVGNREHTVTLKGVSLSMIQDGSVQVLSSPAEIASLVPQGGVDLRHGDVFCVCFRMLVTRPCADLALGTVRLTWESACCTAVANNELSTVVAFPTVTCAKPAIEGDFVYPSSAFVGEAFAMGLRLRNTTEFVQRVTAAVAVPTVGSGVTADSTWEGDATALLQDDTAPAFVVAGFRRRSFAMQPMSQEVVGVTAIPMRPGQFSLPGFTLTSPSKHVPLLTPGSAPSVYVFPSRAPADAVYASPPTVGTGDGAGDASAVFDGPGGMGAEDVPGDDGGDLGAAVDAALEDYVAGGGTVEDMSGLQVIDIDADLAGEPSGDEGGSEVAGADTTAPAGSEGEDGGGAGEGAGAASADAPTDAGDDVGSDADDAGSDADDGGVTGAGTTTEEADNAQAPTDGGDAAGDASSVDDIVGGGDGNDDGSDDVDVDVDAIIGELDDSAAGIAGTASAGDDGDSGDDSEDADDVGLEDEAVTTPTAAVAAPAAAHAGDSEDSAGADATPATAAVADGDAAADTADGGRSASGGGGSGGEGTSSAEALLAEVDAALEDFA